MEGALAEQPAAQTRGQARFSVVALTLRQFSQHPVAEQTRLKAQLEALTAIAIQRVVPSDRLVLDTLDGLVVVVLSSAEEAVKVAESAHDGAADLPLCIALSYGPVKASGDGAAGARFVGDGIVSALTLAGLATRGRMLLSRPFRDALAQSAPHRIRGLSPAGALTDASLRSHEVFTVDPNATASVRRRFMAITGAAVIAILAIGIGARVLHSKPGVIQLEISPEGEVFVDGQLKGKSPPLTRVAVSPGVHTIEVQNGSYAPLRLELNLKPGEELKVAHSFGGRRPRQEGDSFLEDVWRRLSR